MKDPHEYKAFRNTLVQAMRRELFGPARDDSEDERNEELDVSPLQVYGAGILFPRKLRQNVLEDIPEVSESDAEEEPSSNEIEDDLDDIPKADGSGNRAASPGHACLTGRGAGIRFRAGHRDAAQILRKRDRPAGPAAARVESLVFRFRPRAAEMAGALSIRSDRPRDRF